MRCLAVQQACLVAVLLVQGLPAASLAWEVAEVWPDRTRHQGWGEPCLGDLDGDGDLDLVLNHHGEGIAVWRNDGRGSWRDVTPGYFVATPPNRWDVMDPHGLALGCHDDAAHPPRHGHDERDLCARRPGDYLDELRLADPSAVRVCHLQAVGGRREVVEPAGPVCCAGRVAPFAATADEQIADGPPFLVDDASRDAAELRRCGRGLPEGRAFEPGRLRGRRLPSAGGSAAAAGGCRGPHWSSVSRPHRPRRRTDPTWRRDRIRCR